MMMDIQQRLVLFTYRGVLVKEAARWGPDAGWQVKAKQRRDEARRLKAEQLAAEQAKVERKFFSEAPATAVPQSPGVAPKSNVIPFPAVGSAHPAAANPNVKGGPGVAPKKLRPQTRPGVAPKKLRPQTRPPGVAPKKVGGRFGSLATALAAMGTVGAGLALAPKKNAWADTLSLGQ